MDNSSYKPVPSPCIDVCSIDSESKTCKGCYRTMQEIASWPYLNDAEKRDIIATLEERKNGIIINKK